MLVALLFACAGAAKHPSGDSGEASSDPWAVGLSEVQIDQQLYYMSAQTLYSYEDGEFLPSDANWAYAVLWMSSAPVKLLDISSPPSEDRCQTENEGGAIAYVSDTNSKSLTVGDHTARMSLDVTDVDRSYWWDPNQTPDWALDEGLELGLDDLDLQVQTQGQFGLDADPEAWATYVETGTIALQWKAGSGAVLVERPELALDNVGSRCVLVDDGSATITFPSPPLVDVDSTGESGTITLTIARFEDSNLTLDDGQVMSALAENYTMLSQTLP